MTIANSSRIPITTNTITVCAFATTCEPTRFRAVIASTIATAKTFAHAAFSPANSALA